MRISIQMDIEKEDLEVATHLINALRALAEACKSRDFEMRDSNGTDHQSAVDTSQVMPTPPHSSQKRSAPSLIGPQKTAPANNHDNPASPTSPPPVHVPPPASATTPPTFSPKEVLAEVLHSLHRKALQPQDVALVMQQCIADNQVDMLCQGIIEYGLGVVRLQFTEANEITLEQLYDVLLLLPPESRTTLAQKTPAGTGLVPELVTRLNNAYDINDPDARIQLSCYGELMARACGLGMLQLGGVIRAYKTLLGKKSRAPGGVIGLCTLMLRNWDPFLSYMEDPANKPLRDEVVALLRTHTNIKALQYDLHVIADSFAHELKDQLSNMPAE